MPDKRDRHARLRATIHQLDRPCDAAGCEHVPRWIRLRRCVRFSDAVERFLTVTRAHVLFGHAVTIHVADRPTCQHVDGARAATAVRRLGPRFCSERSEQSPHSPTLSAPAVTELSQTPESDIGSRRAATLETSRWRRPVLMRRKRLLRRHRVNPSLVGIADAPPSRPGQRIDHGLDGRRSRGPHRLHRKHDGFANQIGIARIVTPRGEVRTGRCRYIQPVRCCMPVLPLLASRIRGQARSQLILHAKTAACLPNPLRYYDAGVAPAWPRTWLAISGESGSVRCKRPD